MSLEEAQRILDNAECICTEVAVARAVERIAGEITQALRHTNPLVLIVMTGGAVFGGQLLPRLQFPLTLDYIHPTRYSNKSGNKSDDTMRGGELEWRAMPAHAVRGRTVLVIDDILDEGVTLQAVRARLRVDGAAAVHVAVFADKDIGRDKPIAADFVGIRVPNRYVFGFGMDVEGAWRNLPAIYAIKENS